MIPDPTPRPVDAELKAKILCALIDWRDDDEDRREEWEVAADVTSAYFSARPPQWRPIETADTGHSRPVLLWCRMWSEPRIGHWFQATKHRGWWVEENTVPCEPSLWHPLPLPSPPEV